MGSIKTFARTRSTSLTGIGYAAVNPAVDRPALTKGMLRVCCVGSAPSNNVPRPSNAPTSFSR